MPPRFPQRCVRAAPRQHGQAFVEFIVVFIVFVMLGLGALQMALIYRAKNTLDYAAFQAARAGAVHHGSPSAIRSGLARGLAPLYAHGTSKVAVGKARAAAQLKVTNPLLTAVQLVNPTKAAFKDFGKKNPAFPQLGTFIPNNNLAFRPHDKGKNSGLTIQDANVLKLRVVYHYRLIVPIVNDIIVAAAHAVSGTHFGTTDWEKTNPKKYRQHKELGQGDQDYLPIEASAIVRMQSSFTKKNFKGLSQAGGSGHSNGGGPAGGTPAGGNSNGGGTGPGTGAGSGSQSSGGGNAGGGKGLGGLGSLGGSGSSGGSSGGNANGSGPNGGSGGGPHSGGSSGNSGGHSSSGSSGQGDTSGDQGGADGSGDSGKNGWGSTCTGPAPVTSKA